MKGDRVTVRILCDEEATEWAIGERQMLSALSAKEAKLLRDMLKRCAAALEDEPSRT